MTDRNRIVVIGAGHNGLACAAYLAKAGREVVVLEAAERVGGAAVTREFAPGYRVSACAHLLYLLDAERPARARPGLARPQGRAYGPEDRRARARGRAPRARRRARGIRQRDARKTAPRSRAITPGCCASRGSWRSSTTAVRPASWAAAARTRSALRCSAWTSAASAATTCASFSASRASTSSTCSRRPSTRRC